MLAKKDETGLFTADIDGKRYSFEKWGAEYAVDTLMDLVAVTGKPLGVTLGQLLEADKKTIDQMFTADVLRFITDELSDAFFTRKALARDLIKRLASGTKLICNGVQVTNYDQHYKDCLERIFKVAYANLEVQYGNFLHAVSGSLFRAKAPVSLKTSTGAA